MSKRRHEEDEEVLDDDEDMDDDDYADEDEDEEDDEDEDTIDLDKAEEEEEDDDDADDEDDDSSDSTDRVERRRVFQHEAEEILENLTLEDVTEVLKENDLDPKLAPRLKKLLVEVLHEGEVEDMDEAWEEAIERLEEE